MSARRKPSSAPVIRLARPAYEVRAKRFGPGDVQVEVWQKRSPATPHITQPVRIAGLRGRNLELLQSRIVRQLKQIGVRLDLMPVDGIRADVDEDGALRLALFFKALAPMRSRDAMRLVAEGIEAMSREEAAYWLGMAIYRKNPRRVLSALRMLLTDPAR
jgi:hypothetical protein